MRDEYDFGYFADEAIYNAQQEMEEEDKWEELVNWMNMMDEQDLGS